MSLLVLGAGTVAKVVGFPGFIATRPKWMVPFSECWIVGLRRSSSPSETPPVVMRTSTLGKVEARVEKRVSALKAIS